jgi:hypothetical protein
MHAHLCLRNVFYYLRFSALCWVNVYVAVRIRTSYVARFEGLTVMIYIVVIWFTIPCGNLDRWTL